MSILAGHLDRVSAAERDSPRREPERAGVPQGAQDRQRDDARGGQGPRKAQGVQGRHRPGTSMYYRQMLLLLTYATAASSGSPDVSPGGGGALGVRLQLCAGDVQVGRGPRRVLPPHAALRVGAAQGEAAHPGGDGQAPGRENRVLVRTMKPERLSSSQFSHVLLAHFYVT